MASDLVDVSRQYWQMFYMMTNDGKSKEEADKIAREHLRNSGWVKKNGKWYNEFKHMKGNKKRIEIRKKKPKIKTDWEGEKIAKGKSNGRHG